MFTNQVLKQIPEVAQALGISRRYAYDLANSGKLPGAVRIGSVWRVNWPECAKQYGIDPAVIGEVGAYDKN